MKNNKMLLVLGASVLSVGTVSAIALGGRADFLKYAGSMEHEYELNTQTLVDVIGEYDWGEDTTTYVNFNRESVRGGTGTMLLSGYRIGNFYDVSVDFEDAGAYIKNDTPMIGWNSFKLEASHPEKFKIYYSDVATIDENTPYVITADTSTYSFDTTYSYFKLEALGGADFDNITFNYSCNDDKLKVSEDMVGTWEGDFPGTLEFFGYDLGLVMVDVDDDDSPFVLRLEEHTGTSYKYSDADGNTLSLYIGASGTFVFKSGTKLGSFDLSGQLNQMDIHKSIHSESVNISRPGEAHQDEYSVYHHSSNSSLNRIVLQANVTPANSSYRDITWEIVDGEECATIVPGGDHHYQVTVTGVSAGEVWLLATTEDGKEDMVMITVNNPVWSNTVTIVNSDGSAIAGKAMSLDLGQSVNLKAKLEDGVTEDKIGEWTTSDKNVVSVSGNTITAMAPGSADISVTYNKNGVTIKDTITVTVTGAAAIFHAGTWIGVDDNGSDVLWDVTDDGMYATLLIIDAYDDEYEYTFTFDQANETDTKKPFVYDDDDEVIFTMVTTTPWKSSSDVCYLEIIDENWVINDYETFCCIEADNGIELTR